MTESTDQTQRYTVYFIRDADGYWSKLPDTVYTNRADAVVGIPAYIHSVVHPMDLGQSRGVTSTTIACVFIDHKTKEINVIHVTMDLDVSHADLIRQVGGNPDCHHRWSPQGAGSSGHVPGVWQIGQRKTKEIKYCSRCGMTRERIHHGPNGRRRPGEYDTVGYQLGA